MLDQGDDFFLYFVRNMVLASCPWGLATANGMGLLTEMYVTYLVTYTSHHGFVTFGPDLSKISMRPPGPSYIPKIMPIGPLASAGEVATHGRKARKYIRI